MNRKLAVFIPIFTLTLIMIFSTYPVLSASVITPKEVNTLANFSIQFTFKDPNYASTTLGYRVLDDSDAVIESGTFTTDANGEGQFTITFNDAGEYKVQVYNTTDSTVIATAYVHVIDVIGLIMPIIMLIFMLTIVFRVVEVVQKELENI